MWGSLEKIMRKFLWISIKWRNNSAILQEKKKKKTSMKKKKFFLNETEEKKNEVHRKPKVDEVLLC
jgi:hypothetical protein